MRLEARDFSLQHLRHRDARDGRVRRVVDVEAAATLGQRRKADLGAEERFDRRAERPVQRVVQRKRRFLCKKDFYVKNISM
jgi:hypothetical protein